MTQGLVFRPCTRQPLVPLWVIKATDLTVFRSYIAPSSYILMSMLYSQSILSVMMEHWAIAYGTTGVSVGIEEDIRGSWKPP